MGSVGPRRRAVLVLLLAAAAGCGGEPSESGDGSEAASDPAPDTARVFLGEYFIDMPDTLARGVEALEVTNDGMHVHDLWVRPEKGDSALSSFATPLDPGETRVLPLDLEPGRYYLNCQVANHEGRGMYHTVVVAPEGRP